MEKHAVFCLQLPLILNTGTGKKGLNARQKKKSKENPPIKTNTLNPTNPFILILTHLSIFQGKKKMRIFTYTVPRCAEVIKGRA